MKVSNYLSGAVRQFSYWFVHGTLGYPILEGSVLNYKYCERRAAEYIRRYFDSDYSVDKPFGRCFAQTVHSFCNHFSNGQLKEYGLTKCVLLANIIIDRQSVYKHVS